MTNLGRSEERPYPVKIFRGGSFNRKTAQPLSWRYLRHDTHTYRDVIAHSVRLVLSEGADR